MELELERTSSIYLLYNLPDIPEDEDPEDHLRDLLNKIENTERFTNQENHYTTYLISKEGEYHRVPSHLLKYIRAINGAEIKSDVKYTYEHGSHSLDIRSPESHTYPDGVKRTGEYIMSASINVYNVCRLTGKSFELLSEKPYTHYLKYTYEACYTADTKELNGKHKDRVKEILDELNLHYAEHDITFVAFKHECKKKTITLEECHEEEF